MTTDHLPNASKGTIQCKTVAKDVTNRGVDMY